MAARFTRLVVALGLLLGMALPPAAAAVVRLPTSQQIAASPVPAGGADAANARSYFGARYYRADLGRFTTVDPDHASATLDDPQSWNAYAYARNNPLKYVDPDGRRWFTKNGNAVWVDPNKDGSYTSPGEGWAELDPANYAPWAVNVAFVNGNLSFIGETPNGQKILTPWFSEPPLEDTTFSLVSNLTGFASLAARTGGSVLSAVGRAAGQKGVQEMVRAIKKELLDYWRRNQQAGTGAGHSGGHGTPSKRAGADMIRRANEVQRENPELADALRKEGKRMIAQGGGVNHPGGR